MGLWVRGEWWPDGEGAASPPLLGVSDRDERRRFKTRRRLLHAGGFVVAEDDASLSPVAERSFERSESVCR